MVHNVSATCALKLARPDGQSIHLDALIVMAAPDRLRLRAWKMGQTVFDLTLRPDGLWVEVPGNPDRARDVIPATVSAAEFGRQLLWFTGGFFNEAGAIGQNSAGENFILRRISQTGGAVDCEVDRATLTPRRFRMLDSNENEQFVLEMSAYQDFGGIVWPTFLNARARDGQRIEISLSDLEFNAELAPHVFDPPPGARKTAMTREMGTESVSRLALSFPPFSISMDGKSEKRTPSLFFSFDRKTRPSPLQFPPLPEYDSTEPAEVWARGQKMNQPGAITPNAETRR